MVSDVARPHNVYFMRKAVQPVLTEIGQNDYQYIIDDCCTSACVAFNKCYAKKLLDREVRLNINKGCKEQSLIYDISDLLQGGGNQVGD